MAKRESFGSTLDSELLKQLRDLSDNSGVPISRLLDQAVKLLLKQYNYPRDPNKMYVDVILDE